MQLSVTPWFIKRSENVYLTKAKILYDFIETSKTIRNNTFAFNPL